MNENIDLGTIILPEISLSLKDISVVAKQDSKASSNSSLIIDREAIEQTPALSLNDLLNQIPNRKMTPPSLQSVQNVTLRSTYQSTTNGKGAFELSNAFGVAIIMDGNTISNNMNMQSFNAGAYGLSFLSSVTTYGLNGTSNKTGYTGDYTYGGIDLRQIPADNIERVEVVAGVASAKYGDLSEGAIIVDRRAGVAPGYLRTQLRDNATTYSYSQGFKLSEKLGSLSASLNFADAYADARDKLKAYRRINGNMMWSNAYGKHKGIANTFSLDYGKNLDGIKQDPDDPNKTKVRFDSWNFAVANRVNFRIKNGFIKNVGFNLRYSAGHQYSYREQLINDAVIAYTDATTTGIHEGIYESGTYTAYMIIDGRPVNFTARMDINSEFKLAKATHFLSFGVNYNYGKNKGDGQLADPTKPRILARTAFGSSSSNNSERYYDFSRVIAQQDFGFYLEDNVKWRIGYHTLHMRPGIRLDVQNGFVTASPRINTTYTISHDWQMGLAYGISYKSPGLAQRYPGPTFTEIPLLNAFNGKAAESQYLVYVYRQDPTNKDLQSTKTQTLEWSTQYHKNGFNVSANIYAKWTNNGISTISTPTILTLPTYSATYQTDAKPIVTETGTKNYFLSTSHFGNVLTTNSQGIELILNTSSISTLMTSFNLSGGYMRSHYNSKQNSYSSFLDATRTDPDYARMGVYPPTVNTSFQSNIRLSSITHIPKLSLVIQFTAETNLVQKTITEAKNGIPVAYYTNDYRYIKITDFDKNNPNYGFLYKPESELNAENQTKAIWNFHLSIAKEIKKRFRISFNVYNAFNYQPYYINSANQKIYPNAAPTFGAELSIKL